MKKITVLLLVGLLLLSSCSNTVQTPAKDVSSDVQAAETVTETDETVLPDNLPDNLNYDGKDFNLLSPDDYGGQSFTESETGDVLNDAQYAVKKNVGDRLNCVVTETLSPFWDMQKNVVALVLSGDSTYDSITMMDRFAYSVVGEGIMLPIQELEYVDLSAKYWGDILSEQLTAGGKSMFAVGSFNLKAYQDISCVLMNTVLAENCSVKAPYADVDNGSWTFEKMKSLATSVASDINGDGVMDEKDRYGLGTIDGRAISEVIWVGAGENTVRKDEAGNLYVAVYDNERFVKILEDVYGTFFNSNIIQDMKVSYKSDFGAGNVLFNFSYFKLLAELRDMEDDFTVLPIPKYDETQESYITRTFDTMFTMVPVTVKDKSFAGAVLEALSSEGYKSLLPVYIQTSLQDKYTRDEYSAKYVQLAFDTRCVDIGEAFMFDIFGDTQMYALMTSGSLNITSYLERKRGGIDSAVEKMGKILSGDYEA